MAETLRCILAMVACTAQVACTEQVTCTEQMTCTAQVACTAQVECTAQVQPTGTTSEDLANSYDTCIVLSCYRHGLHDSKIMDVCRCSPEHHLSSLIVRW